MMAGLIAHRLDSLCEVLAGRLKVGPETKTTTIFCLTYFVCFGSFFSRLDDIEYGYTLVKSNYDLNETGFL